MLVIEERDEGGKVVRRFEFANGEHDQFRKCAGLVASRIAASRKPAAAGASSEGHTWLHGDRCDIPWHGRKMHPYGNGQFDGELAELLRITRQWYYCDVRPPVAERLFGAEDTEAKMQEW